MPSCIETNICGYVCGWLPRLHVNDELKQLQLSTWTSTTHHTTNKRCTAALLPDAIEHSDINAIMPLTAGQKGTSKKGKDAARQSRSRNSTPSLAGASVGASSEQGDSTSAGNYLDLAIHPFRSMAADEFPELLESGVPSSKALDSLLGRLLSLISTIEHRETICDKGMRKLSSIRKDRVEEVEQYRREQERQDRLKREHVDDIDLSRIKVSKNKKAKDASKSREERPLTHGAHQVAPQDGSSTGRLIFLPPCLGEARFNTTQEIQVPRSASRAKQRMMPTPPAHRFHPRSLMLQRHRKTKEPWQLMMTLTTTRDNQLQRLPSSTTNSLEMIHPLFQIRPFMKSCRSSLA